jgi:hypothetical protein
MTKTTTESGRDDRTAREKRQVVHVSLGFMYFDSGPRETGGLDFYSSLKSRPPSHQNKI